MAHPHDRRRAVLAFPFLVLAGALHRPGTAMTVIDLATDAAPWQVVNDNVMGGVSTSQIAAATDGVRFSGMVRTEYNGGFASARRAVDAAAVAADVRTFALRARGDGHRYRLTVYVRAAGGGLQSASYYAEFDTVEQTDVDRTLPLMDFRATFRGRPVPDAPPLRWRDVAGVGLMLTKAGHLHGRGAFNLHLLSLRPVP
jgi:hypothetical protein